MQRKVCTPGTEQEGRGEAAKGAGRGQQATYLQSGRGEHVPGFSSMGPAAGFHVAGRWREEVTQPEDKGRGCMPAVLSYPMCHFSDIWQVYLLSLFFSDKNHSGFHTRGHKQNLFPSRLYIIPFYKMSRMVRIHRKSTSGSLVLGRGVGRAC